MLVFLAACSLAAVRRPSSEPHAITFEGVSTHCNFAHGVPLSSEYEALHFVKFEGPGFGTGFLGFSTLHAFHERTGKPISPETIRFDVRVTNVVASFAVVDGHAVTVELWS